MDLEAKVDALLEAAGNLDVEIRREDLAGHGGGLCKIGRRWVLFVDVAADVVTQYERILRDLAQFPDIDNVYLSPELREDIDRMQRDG